MLLLGFSTLMEAAGLKTASLLWRSTTAEKDDIIASDLDLDNARLTVKQALGQTRAGVHFKKPKDKKSNRTVAVPETLTDEYIAFTGRVTAREIRFHDLRHTHASKLLRRGIPLKTVSQRLGHANPTVTLDIYAHVMSGDDEKAAKTPL
jgi:integrase